MTAQANTAGTADANAQGTGQQDTPGADPTGTQTRNQAQPTDGAQANPQQQANPNANQVDGGDLDQQIATAEKRQADKEAYLKKLEDELRDRDRQISERKQKLKEQGERHGKHAEPVGTPDQGNQQGLSDHQAAAARELGLTGQEFLDLMANNPDQGIAKLVEVAQRQVLQGLPQYLDQHQAQQQLMDRANRTYQELSPDDKPAFNALVAEYQQQGLLPSPEQVANEIRFGTPDQQKQLMEYGLAYLQSQQQAAPQDQQQQQAHQQPGMRPHPMAPGGGSPVQPQQRQTNGQPSSPLRNAGWNV